jgi:hypothetical protein
MNHFHINECQNGLRGFTSVGTKYLDITNSRWFPVQPTWKPADW